MEEGTLLINGKKIWYCVYGKEKAGIPILVVHGGPGFCSITEEIRELAEKRPVYFYDQSGSGKSEPCANESEYSVSYFKQELEEVIRELSLSSLHLMGHSWGGSLVTAFYLEKQPRAVKSLILASPFLSISSFEENIQRNLGKLTYEERENLERLIHDQNFGEEFQGALFPYYKHFLTTKKSSMELAMPLFMAINPAIYGKLWGPGEILMTGELKDFELKPDLSSLNLPVLLIAGDQDEIDAEAVREFQNLIPGAWLSIIPHAGHLVYLDQPEIFRITVNTFLESIET